MKVDGNKIGKKKKKKNDRKSLDGVSFKKPSNKNELADAGDFKGKAKIFNGLDFVDNSASSSSMPSMPSATKTPKTPKK